MVGATGAWGQTLPFEVTTADDITNHSEKFYWIESVGATGFYAVPHSDDSKASTTNAPTLRALWYFMASDDDGYYYIINKETRKYLKKTGDPGTDNTIGVADYAAGDDAKFKFSFATPNGITEGYWVIYPKEAGTAGWLSKKSGNIRYDLWLKVSNWNNTPVGDVNSQWKIVAKDGVQWPQSGLPFVVSTSSDKHYYRINHAQSTDYNISYDANNNVTISTEFDNKTAWYFEEAATDPNIDNLKYYYIVNASSGKYLKFTATTINGSNQNDKFTLSDYVEGDAERFQFVMVNSYNGNARYSIMPKLAMSKYDVNNYANSMVPTNDEKLDLRSDRNNDKAHWNFVTTEYPMKCTISSITYDSSTGKITITSSPSFVDIHYTLDGTTVPSSEVGTLYSEPFGVSSTVTIKAIATKDGYVDSDVTTESFNQVATPSIQNNGSNAISITCATEGATIYYTTNGDTPNTSSAEYTVPLTENVSGVTIRAIAVKDGMINSAVQSGSVTLQCAKPIIAKSGDNVTISCNFPASGVSIYYTTNGDDPTSSSALYSGAILVSSGDVIKAIAIASGYDDSEVATKTIHTDLTPTDGKYLINNSADFETFVDMASEVDGAGFHYILKTNVDASTVAAIPQAFTGIFDGDNYTITGLSHPLFNTVDGGTVKNVILKNVSILSKSGPVGAIAGTASGYSRIYNCGILPSDKKYESLSQSRLSSSDNYCGGLVGWLKDDSRVINCFSYANIEGGTYVAGIVGYNQIASNTDVSDGKYANLRTAVVNCMFYGNITGGSNRYPVYGGAKIVNNTSTGINNYDFYRAESSVGTLTDYNCSWPAKEEYLRKYEFYRNLLNSNRELCGWWVGAPSAPSTMSTTAVQEVPKDASLMAKWVVDSDLAPYPILKPFGKYSSSINIDANASWRTTANEWEGKNLGTLKVTINPGTHAAGGASTKSDVDFVITDMDTLRADYCYRKIQLPYYNTEFGNPNGDTWAAKYGGNYGDYVVIGWKVSTSEGTAGELSENWETGYNFADRNCTAKDANRVFAQGGYYYVPNGVENITITAQWASAIYLDNTGRYYDRVSVSSYDNTTDPKISVGSSTLYPFAPAGTRPETLGNGKTVQNGSISSKIPSGGSVYNNAIVLVGNHQFFTGGSDVKGSADSDGCTIMSADFNCDDEPDYCLEWQLGTKTTRQNICPIRFDFLPVAELGMALKEDGSTQYYSLGCYHPLGHFEVTETSLIHFGQFEFSNARTVNSPIILNGGIFDQYTKGTIGGANADKDKITYIILGGNVKMPSFTPGAHVNSGYSYSTRHCAVNVLGGNIDYLYLTGNYNETVKPNQDNPHCYIDGGRFKQVAAAGKEGINGNVFFKINHSKIWEFYGGSTMDVATGDYYKIVKGNIDVTIDNSIVDKYCGGPKFGNMIYDKNNFENGKTITTNATNTIFGVYYGGGNGGTSYVQYAKTDGEQTASANFSWSGTGKLNEFTPGNYRDEATGYMADYDMEIVNTSAGTNQNKAIYRTYFYAAQFSATNTGPVTNNLTNCTVLTNFFGGGNLGGVVGSVTSTLDGTTHIYGSAYGAGYSAKVSEVIIHNKDKVAPTINVNTGIITPESGGTGTTYTWTHESNLGGQTLNTSTNKTVTVNGVNYLYTTKSLDNLGAVSGAVTLTIKGNSKIDNDVFGGGDSSAVINTTTPTQASTTVNLQGNAQVQGNVFGGGNRGIVSGTATVNIQNQD